MIQSLFKKKLIGNDICRTSCVSEHLTSSWSFFFFYQNELNPIFHDQTRVINTFFLSYLKRERELFTLFVPCSFDRLHEHSMNVVPWAFSTVCDIFKTRKLRNGHETITKLRSSLRLKSKTLYFINFIKNLAHPKQIKCN